MIQNFNKKPSESVDKERFSENIEYTDTADKNKIATDDKVSTGCLKNNRSGVIIDAVHNSLSFDDLLDPTKSDFLQNVDYNLFCILFQIYAALATLSDNFTHYDLHTGNILYTYLPKPIQINYFDNGKVYSIFTKYIPVIIDYGRCYVNCKNLAVNINSSDFMDVACKTDNCRLKYDNYDNCNLLYKGLIARKYNWRDFDNEKDANDHKGEWYPNNDYDYINPRIRNRSHDLRFLWLIMEYPEYTKHYENTTIYSIINIYFNTEKNKEWATGELGVPENIDSYVTGSIKTVNDVFELLKDIYNTETSRYHVSRNKISDVIGRMNIYTNLKTKWKFYDY